VEQQEEPVRIPITDVFDLHSVPPRDVAPIVAEYLEEARKLGFKALRIIRTPFVADFRDAPAEAGGWGATLVTLQESCAPKKHGTF
jgi:DNA-nicking Smr family endonuclease